MTGSEIHAEELPSVALVGIGGYGANYVKRLLALDDQTCRVVGVVDPYPDGCGLLSDIRARQWPVFQDQAELYAQSKPELTVLSSPIHLHAPQLKAALAAGSHVLCEKPLAPTLADARAMQAAAAASDRFVEMGYQHAFYPANQQLRAEIAAGKFGRPLDARVCVEWPRSHRYYQRNNWAGMRATPDGRPVHDSPLQNATAHFLHYVLHLLGGIEGGLKLVSVEAELYRANPITNYDTAFLRIRTAPDIPILYLTSHAVKQERGPLITLHFEHATLTAHGQSGDVIAHFSNGTEEIYPVSASHPMQKLSTCIDFCRHGYRPICPIESAIQHTRIIETLAQDADAIRNFPESLCETIPWQAHADDQINYVKGLDMVMQLAFENGELPSESGVPWAQKTGPLSVLQ